MLAAIDFRRLEQYEPRRSIVRGAFMHGAA
jgi:hypothetical protein